MAAVPDVEADAPAFPPPVVPRIVAARVIAALLRRAEAGDLASAELLLRFSSTNPIERPVSALAPWPEAEPSQEPGPRSDGYISSRWTRLREEVQAAAREAEATCSGVTTTAIVGRYAHRGASRASLHRWCAEGRAEAHAEE